jgi:hypothetical protein
MFKRNRTTAANTKHVSDFNDAGLQQIDAYEAAIIRACDEKATFFGVDANEVAHFRPGVVAQAKAVCAKLRSEYRARTS